jgi:phenylacetate-CoA ligase
MTMRGADQGFELVREEIAYAFGAVPFFERHLREAGVDPSDLRSPADLARVPLTDKAHYRSNFPAGVLARGYRLDDPRLYRASSSGSTGERLTTVELGGLYLERALRALEVNPALLPPFVGRPRRHCRFAAPNCSDVECASPHAGMADRTLPDGTLVLSAHHDLFTTPDEMLAQNFAEIAAYGPSMFYADPNHLAFLLRRAHSLGAAPPRVPALLSYTPCTLACARLLADALGDETPCAPVVAMSELGFVAATCPRGGLHANDASFYFEFVRGGQAARPGELAELVVTSFHRGCCPHVRYATGDAYRRLEGPCPCGHPSPLVRFEGRVSHLIFRGGRPIMTPLELDEAVGAPAGLWFYQLRQLDEDDFRFAYVAEPPWSSADEAELSGRLRARLGDGARLRCVRSRYIPCAPGGKLLACESAVGQAFVDAGGRL